MELCANRALSSVNLRLGPSLPLNRTISSFIDNPGSVCCKNKYLRATVSDDSPSETSKFDRATSSRMVVVEDLPSVGKIAFWNSFQGETSREDSPSDEEIQPFGGILDKLNLKLDTEDPYSLILYGAGALVSIWLLSAIVGAIDSIPLFPKLMEVVGLSYTLWFTTRYLIFKKNRDELGAKIEELKQQVIGSDED